MSRPPTYTMYTDQDRQLTEALCQKHEGLFRKLAFQFDGTLEEGDALNVCRRHVLSGYKAWDPAKSSELSYLSYWLKSKLRAFARMERRARYGNSWRHEGYRTNGGSLSVEMDQLDAPNKSTGLDGHHTIGELDPAYSLDSLELDRLLSLLPAHDREIIRQHDIEGYCFGEIAKGLGMSRQAVHQKYHGAMQKLKAHASDLAAPPGRPID